MVFAHVSWAGTMKHLILQQNQALLHSEEIVEGVYLRVGSNLVFFKHDGKILFQTQSHSVVTVTLQLEAIATRPLLQTANDTAYVFRDDQELANWPECHWLSHSQLPAHESSRLA